MSSYSSSCLHLFKPSDGIYKTSIKYKHYQKQFKLDCQSLFKRDGPFGTHTCRKTGYLFAIWQEGEWEEIMSSARHSDLKSAQKYSLDSKYLWHLAKENNSPFAHTMGKFRPIFAKSEQLGRCLNEQGSLHYQPVFMLANNFLTNLCRIEKNSLNFSISYVFEKAFSYNCTSSLMEQIKNWMSLNVIEGRDNSPLLDLVERFSDEKVTAITSPSIFGDFI